MSAGPWYEYHHSPSNEDVKQILLNTQWDRQFGDNCSSWYPIMKRRVIDNVIKELKIQQPCWGTYRRYYSLSHSILLSKCLEEAHKFRKEKATKKLLEFMNNSIWIQDRLYRPEDGLRYNNIEDNFNIVKNSLEKIS